MKFSKSDIKAHVGSTYYQRGADYFARSMVQSIEEAGQTFDTLLFTSRVKGSGKKAYQQTTFIRKTSNYISIRSDCSCPLAGNCKHVVAALLAWLDQAKMQNSVITEKTIELSPDLNILLDRLASAAEKDAPNYDPENYPPEIRNRLIYWLGWGRHSTGIEYVTLDLQKVSILKDGSFGSQCSRFSSNSMLSGIGPKYLRPSDHRIIEEIRYTNRYNYSNNQLAGKQGVKILGLVLATGRCFWTSHKANSTPLTLGPELEANGYWLVDTSGTQKFTLDIPTHPKTKILPLDPPWYCDPKSHQCGLLKSDSPPALTTALLKSPKINGREVGEFRKALQSRLKGHKIPLPKAPKKSQHRNVKPKPRLTLKLGSVKTFDTSYWNQKSSTKKIPVAELDFFYDGHRVLPDDDRQEFEILKDDILIIIPRDFRSEDKAFNQLFELGLYTPDDDFDVKIPRKFENAYYVVDDYDYAPNWFQFIQKDLPELIKKGWKVEITEEFPFVITDEPEHWSVGFEGEESENDWFSLSLGVQIGDEKIDLVPVLLNLLEMLPDVAGEDIIDVIFSDDEGSAFLPLGDGRFIPIPAERLRPLLQNLFELFGERGENAGTINRLRLGDIAALEQAAIEAGAVIEGAKALRTLAKKLTGGAKIAPVPIPAGLEATLRPYQSEGLDWLQFLAEVGLGGILADDMGLGKTMQTLAHILTEKENGRLEKPCLLVVPTSLIPNWRIEAERFAPSLKILTLHGSKRKERFCDILSYNIILTSYALIHRDREVLLEHKYHFAIFDEAQAIKNPSSNAAKFACEVTALQKICLSGTPVENHLGELWSLFHCVAPGLLGERKAFQKNFRTPIEKQGDGDKQAILNRRVLPFLLRRTKDAVATELPPKTETTEHVALEGKQRDLYETVRLSMDKKVRAEISSKGMARSHITVLDALLKLRQTCCDPRLVKLDAARKVAASAKLERLCEMLPELIEDGRKVLLFSQFTSMLSLIEESLEKLNIPYVLLTGNTKDRETPVRQFQAGEVPLFLISLKAGGTGLNLTAADTVIHYDPWWNPAVERQATDRAHRIGQDKPVFVYKLAARGTVEERMLELQVKKSALAEALYDGKANPSKALSEQDITWLLAPLTD